MSSPVPRPVVGDDPRVLRGETRVRSLDDRLDPRLFHARPQLPVHDGPDAGYDGYRDSEPDLAWRLGMEPTSFRLLDQLKVAGPDAADWNRLQAIYLPLIERCFAAT